MSRVGHSLKSGWETELLDKPIDQSSRLKTLIAIASRSNAAPPKWTKAIAVQAVFEKKTSCLPKCKSSRNVVAE